MKPHEHVILEIAGERERQMAEEGWTPEHDDKHDNDEMAFAAACYAMGRDSVSRGFNSVESDLWAMNASLTVRLWPWDRRWWKPKKRRHDLIRAAALIVAEIERLDRALRRARKDDARDA